jgi:hypothetical protein
MAGEYPPTIALGQMRRPRYPGTSLMFRARRALVNLLGYPARMATIEPTEMTLEMALAIVRENGEQLGGVSAAAAAIVCRAATRSVEREKRTSSMKLQAVGGLALGSQNFAKANEILAEVRHRADAASELITEGMAEMGKTSRVVREIDAPEDDSDPRRR